MEFYFQREFIGEEFAKAVLWSKIAAGTVKMSLSPRYATASASRPTGRLRSSWRRAASWRWRARSKRRRKLVAGPALNALSICANILHLSAAAVSTVADHQLTPEL